MNKAFFARSACLAALVSLSPVGVAVPQAGPGERMDAGQVAIPAFSSNLYVPPALAIPQGWREQQTSDGRLVLIGPDGFSTIIAYRDTVSLKAATERLGQPIDISAGVSLSPRSLPRSEGDRVRNDFIAFGFEPLTAGQVIIHTEEAGRALILIGLTQAGMETQLAQALSRMVPFPETVVRVAD